MQLIQLDGLQNIIPIYLYH